MSSILWLHSVRGGRRIPAIAQPTRPRSRQNPFGCRVRGLVVFGPDATIIAEKVASLPGFSIAIAPRFSY